MAFIFKHHRVLVYQLAKPDWAFQPDLTLSIYNSLNLLSLYHFRHTL